MLLVVAGGTANGAYSSWLSGNRIAPGLYIQGEPVGGLTAKEAQKRLKSVLAAYLSSSRHQSAVTNWREASRRTAQFNRAVLNAYYYGRGGNRCRTCGKSSPRATSQ
jgi:hypothetical protein